jgi:predicted RNA-binding Zn-ribbon protein involved in translation (DUF1610 family)
LDEIASPNRIGFDARIAGGHAAFSADGSTLVVVEHQGAIKLWRAPPLAEIDAEQKKPRVIPRDRPLQNLQKTVACFRHVLRHELMTATTIPPCGGKAVHRVKKCRPPVPLWKATHGNKVFVMQRQNLFNWRHGAAEMKSRTSIERNNQ